MTFKATESRDEMMACGKASDLLFELPEFIRAGCLNESGKDYAPATGAR